MAHQFTVNANIQGVSIDEFKRLANDINMHEAVCRRIPAQNMEGSRLADLHLILPNEVPQLSC